MILPINYGRASPAERRAAREEYARRQGGLCYLCKAPLSGPPAQAALDLTLDLSIFPPNFLKWPVHLHHSHDSGLTLGAVHAHCNGVLFQYFGE